MSSYERYRNSLIRSLCQQPSPSYQQVLRVPPQAWTMWSWSKLVTSEKRKPKTSWEVIIYPPDNHSLYLSSLFSSLNQLSSALRINFNFQHFLKYGGNLLRDFYCLQKNISPERLQVVNKHDSKFLDFITLIVYHKISPTWAPPGS